MTSKGYDTIAVATTIRQTIGHHSLAHMARKRPPNVIERKVFEVRKWLEDLETKGIFFNF